MAMARNLVPAPYLVDQSKWTAHSRAPTRAGAGHGHVQDRIWQVGHQPVVKR